MQNTRRPEYHPDTVGQSRAGTGERFFSACLKTPFATTSILTRAYFRFPAKSLPFPLLTQPGNSDSEDGYRKRSLRQAGGAGRLSQALLQSRQGKIRLGVV